MRACQEGNRVDAPEDRVVEAPWIRAITPVYDGNASHHETAQPIDMLKSYHACSDFFASSARSCRSSSKSRVQWTTNAQIAVGIAQIANCVGSTWIPF